MYSQQKKKKGGGGRGFKKKSKLGSVKKGCDCKLCSPLTTACHSGTPTCPPRRPSPAEPSARGLAAGSAETVERVMAVPHSPPSTRPPSPGAASRSASLTSARPGGSSRGLAAMPGQSRVPRYRMPAQQRRVPPPSSGGSRSPQSSPGLAGGCQRSEQQPPLFNAAPPFAVADY